MQTAPWLYPPDYIRAMQAGGALGAERRGQNITMRGQDIGASEAAGRLGLGYAQLGAEEQMAQARSQQAAAAMALRKEQEDLLNQYRQGELANAAKRTADAEARAAQLAGRPTLHNVGGQLLAVDPNLNVTPLTGGPAPKTSPFALKDYDDLLRQMRDIDKQLDKMATDQNVVIPTGKDADALRTKRGYLQQQADQLRGQGQQPSAADSLLQPPGQPPAAPGAAAAPGTDTLRILSITPASDSQMVLPTGP